MHSLGILVFARLTAETLGHRGLASVSGYMDSAGLGALSPAEREAHDDARLAFYSWLAVVATPDVAQVTLIGRWLIVLNRHQLSARRGLIVTGGAILE